MTHCILSSQWWAQLSFPSSQSCQEVLWPGPVQLQLLYSISRGIPKFPYQAQDLTFADGYHDPVWHVLPLAQMQLLY